MVLVACFRTSFIVFFFFQAEDGIRDLTVTGVQTCALPIFIPALLPGFVGGLKQGWAFAWRSLMAGELLVIIGNRPSLGVRLQYAREFSDAQGLLAWMLVVLAVGIAIEALVFARIETMLRVRRGLGS